MSEMPLEPFGTPLVRQPADSSGATPGPKKLNTGRPNTPEELELYRQEASDLMHFTPGLTLDEAVTLLRETS